MKVISIGEVLWDVVGSAEHLGGAPLNFAANIAKLGHSSYMVSAVADDDRGRRALSRIAALGLSTEFIFDAASHPTGHVSVELETDGQPRFTIHRPAAYDDLKLTDSQLERVTSLQPDCIYFGTLAQIGPVVRSVTRTIIKAAPGAKRFYDVNLRTGCYDRETVVELLQSCDFLKLNDAEVGVVAKLSGCAPHGTLPDFCEDFAARFNCAGVCVTRASAGCALLLNGEYVEAPGYQVKVVDAIGAGDAFAAALLHAVRAGWDAPRAADFANRLGALVASRAGAIPEWKLEELEALYSKE